MLKKRKKEFRLKVQALWSDPSGIWMRVLDEKDREWTITPDAFEVYKYSGFCFVSESVADKMYKVLQGKHYAELPKASRYNLIVKTLEAFGQRPIEKIFPTMEG